MRNVVLVTYDSLRADHCGFMGYERETTPTLDAMASEGLSYENAIAPSVPTGPSMMGTLTGEFCQIDAEDFTQEAWLKSFNNRKTIARAFNENGYDTAAFHANPYASSFFGFDDGFDTFRDFVKDKELKTLTSNSTLNAYLATVERLVRGSGTSITWEQLYDPVQEWLASVSEPYFLWVLLLDTHTPYMPPEDHRNWSEMGSIRQIYTQWKAQQRGWQGEADDPLTNQLRDLYDDEIRYADGFLDRLLEDTSGDNPLVVVHGDHGEAFGEHEYLRHPAKIHEELVHVPLVIGNTEQSRHIEKPVSLRDLPQTVTSLAGVDTNMPGESFAEEGRDWVYTQVFNDGKVNGAVRTTDWKYIGHEGEDEDGSLYHLAEDPCEQRDVRDTYPDIAAELEHILTARVGDQSERRAIREMTTELGEEP